MSRSMGWLIVEMIVVETFPHLLYDYFLLDKTVDIGVVSLMGVCTSTGIVKERVEQTCIIFSR
jgi:hypothetical protein